MADPATISTCPISYGAISYGKNGYRVGGGTEDGFRLKFIGLVGSYNKLFVKEFKTLNVSKVQMASIKRTQSERVFNRALLSPYENFLLKHVVDQLVELEILRPSKSKYSAPARPAYVNGMLDLVVNYHYLNSITKTFVHPMPTVYSIIQSIETANVFSKIVIKDPLHQIGLTEKSKKKTAFLTDFGRYEFNVLHPGMKNAEQYLQCLIDTVLEKVDPNEFKVYDGHILVHSFDFDDHFETLKGILKQLRDANLLVDVEQSIFAVNEINYLGYNLSSQGISIDKENIIKISNFPTPASQADVRSFLGLIYQFRDHVTNFDKLVGPLKPLLCEDVVFDWSDGEQNAFDELKRTFVYSSSSKPFKAREYTKLISRLSKVVYKKCACKKEKKMKKMKMAEKMKKMENAEKMKKMEKDKKMKKIGKMKTKKTKKKSKKN